MKAGLLVALVGVAGLAFAAGRFTAPASIEDAAARDDTTPAVSSEVRSPGRKPAAADGSAPLELLERCTERLAVSQARLAAARAESTDEDRGGTALDPTADDATTRRSCLRRPDVLQACRERFAPDASETEGSAALGSSAAGAAGPEFARRFATGVVGVSDAEAEWVEDYLCSVHRLRETMVGDLDDLLQRAADPGEIDEVIEGARADRQAVLEDLETRLGDQRYARLRAVGGLGVMGSALDCPPG